MWKLVRIYRHDIKLQMVMLMPMNNSPVQKTTAVAPKMNADVAE